MEDLIINIIYDLIKNYNNNEELKMVEIEKMTNLLNENVIQIKVGKEYYIVECFKSFVEK